MSDAICRKCGEPWELYYLAHEGLWDYPGAHAPTHLREAHENLMLADSEFEAKGCEIPDDHHYKAGGQDLQNAVLKGEGCPSCWHDPKRATLSEDDSLEALRHNLFDSNWDGDPAELF